MTSNCYIIKVKLSLIVTLQPSKQKKASQMKTIMYIEIYRNRKHKKYTQKHIYRRTYIHKKHTQ